jgi:hypothetical protein
MTEPRFLDFPVPSTGWCGSVSSELHTEYPHPRKSPPGFYTTYHWAFWCSGNAVKLQQGGTCTNISLSISSYESCFSWFYSFHANAGTTNCSRPLSSLLKPLPTHGSSLLIAFDAIQPLQVNKCRWKSAVLNLDTIWGLVTSLTPWPYYPLPRERALGTQ